MLRLGVVAFRTAPWLNGVGEPSMDGEPLKKMLSAVENGKVGYALRLGIRTLPMAERIGKPLRIRFTGARTCEVCGKRVKKFYGQGLCYPCLVSAPEASECIVRPELCQAHVGGGRDPQWEKNHHYTEHFVYLSQTGTPSRDKPTGGIKVGVTRGTQIPVRWVDQGAVLAVIIARTPYRQLAGAIEVALKASLADKTDYRRMLQRVAPDHAALLAARDAATTAVPAELAPFMLVNEEPLALDYPLAETLPKVISTTFEKLPEIEGRLLGIKGQYLLWADGRVLNIRNHSGYHVEVEW